MTSSSQPRVPVDIDADLYSVLEARAKDNSRAVSDFVDEAVRDLLQDLEDLQVFEERAGEEPIPLEEFIRDMKEDGEL